MHAILECVSKRPHKVMYTVQYVVPLQESPVSVCGPPIPYATAILAYIGMRHNLCGKDNFIYKCLNLKLLKCLSFSSN